MTPVIEVTNAVKQFDSVRALDELSLSVIQGQVVAVLGPNGAGKTTLLEVLEGLERLDAGEARVLGYDVGRQTREVKERIGISLQATAFFDRLSVQETAQLFGSFFSRRQDLPSLLQTLGLWELRERRVSGLSGGQRQRVALAMALINDPQVIFLDEPTTGLDPAARREIWSLVEHVRQEGRTVILTTHYMEEAAYLADNVIIMDQGKILAEGSVGQLLRDYTGEQTLILDGEGLDYLTDPPWNFVADNGRLVWHVPNLSDHLDRLLSYIRSRGSVIHHLVVREATLEDVFLRLTGRRLVS
ncbi:MAG: ABC transporter ATP-binding protein [Firmicutes bacterium]|jgi:ABC-2 type transport system ATP-binding protein|nr:ABC transporter ATP-binding protein [Bacillota bacterium]MCL5015096.1 ABC transporter ATP-binding protein [Bacillota bacterium]